MHFPLRTAFAVPYTFCYVFFPFSVVSKYLFSFSLDFFFGPLVFRSMLFDLHILVNFTVFSCNLFHTTVVRCDFNVLKIIKSCFVVSHVIISRPMFHVPLGRKNVYSVVFGLNVVASMSVRST